MIGSKVTLLQLPVVHSLFPTRFLPFVPSRTSCGSKRSKPVANGDGRYIRHYLKASVAKCIIAWFHDPLLVEYIFVSRIYLVRNRGKDGPVYEAMNDPFVLHVRLMISEIHRSPANKHSNETTRHETIKRLRGISLNF